MKFNFFVLDKLKILRRLQCTQINSICRKRLYSNLNNSCFCKNYIHFNKNLSKCNDFQNSLVLIKRFAVTKQSNHYKLNKFEILRLLSLAKPEKWKIFGAVCLLLLSSSVTMAVPYSLGKVLDIIYSNSESIEESKKNLSKVCTILIGVFIAGALCNFGRVYILSCTGYRITQKLRKNIFSAIMQQEQRWFDRKSTGELVNRLSADTLLVGQALSSNLSDGLRSTFAVVAGSGMMFYTSPELALVGLSVVPPIAVLAVIYGRFVRKITRAVQDGLADATTLAEEKISNIRTVRMFAQESREIENYGNKINYILNLGYKESLARAGFYGTAGLAGNSVVIGVLYYGGTMIYQQQSITIGALSSFLMYAAYIGVSVGGLTRFYTEMNRSLGAATRLWEIIDRQPKIPIKGGITLDAPLSGRVTFDNVKFGYNDNQIVLEDVKLDIRPGETVAVVGPSGSGKTTLASLLLRLYEPISGGVYLDGVDVKNLDPFWLRSSIGTVSQEPVLFSGTIRDNILYGAGSLQITEQQLQNIVKEANLFEFINQLPDGLDTMVGERGLTLSGGQRQRIAIARALVKRPNILLLDEATSALDAKSEYLVREALEKAAKGRTVLTIAHRLSTIRNASTIAVLQDGKIVETGTYKDLMSKPEGKFRELVMHQTFKDE